MKMRKEIYVPSKQIWLPSDSEEVLNIGSDADGVLTILDDWYEQVAVPHFQKLFGKEDVVLNPEAYDIRQMFNCSEDEYFKFGLQHIWNYSTFWPFRPDAAPVFKKWQTEGFRIPIITAKKFVTDSNFKGPLFRTLFEFQYWLHMMKKGVKWDGVDYCAEETSPIEKSAACKKHRCKYMLEDKMDNIQALREVVEFIIKFNANYNKDCDYSNVYEVNTFREADEVIHALEAGQKVKRRVWER